MSSLKDLASLIMVPSLVKDGRLDTVKPLGNSIIHPDATGNNDGTDGSTPAEGNFTFSRGSNLAATRVDVNGLIEKGRENNLLQSNTFDNATWELKRTGSNGLPVITSGFADPNGGSNAYRFQITAPSVSNDYSVIQQSPSFSGTTGTPFVQSIYVKANGSGQIGKTFDLYCYQSSTSSYRSIENFVLTGNWQRVELFHTFNGTGSTIEVNFGKARSSAGGSTLATMATDVLIYQSQLEKGLVATDYIETGASTAQAGILEDLPRLDYSGGASCPALLLEPQRSNVITSSEYFNSWATAGTTPTFTNNYGVSPEGLQNSTRVQLDNSDIFYKNPALSQGAYVFSVFAKAISGGASEIILRIDIPSSKRAVFDLSDGTIVSNNADDADIIDYGNGWYRCILIQDNDTIINAVIEEYSDSLDCEIWGAQLEAGSYPTSYIPTYGSAVTRSNDDIETATLSAISGGEVSYFLDIDGAFDPSTNSTSANLRWYFYSGSFVTWNNNTTSYHRIRCTTSLGNEYFTLPASRTERCKVCVLLTATNIKVISNGVVVGSRTIDGDWSSTNKIDSSITNAVGVVPIKQILLFPTRLTEAEAIALTTI